MPKVPGKKLTREQLRRKLARLERKLATLEQKAAGPASSANGRQESPARYRRLFEESKDGIVLIDGATGRILQVNRAFAEMAGLAGRTLLGRPLWELGPLEGLDIGQVAIRELQSQDRIFYDDLPFLRSDGTRTSVELTCSAHSLGRRSVVQCLFRDIAPRKRLERQLERSEARFRALFRHAHVGIAFLDPAGRVLDSNPAFSEMLGYSEHELRGRAVGSLVHPADQAAELPLFQELLEGSRDAYRVTCRHLRRDGALLWGLVGATSVGGADRSSPLIIRITEDITDRKRAEETVIRSRDFYRSLLNELPNPIRLADTDGHCDYFNSAWRSFTGRRMEHELGEGWTDSVHPEDRERVLALFRTSVAGRSPFTTEYRLRRGGGDYRWIVEFGNPFSDMAGVFAGYVSSCYDIHDRKALEEALKSISLTDDLTGLLNRRGFFTLAQQQVRIANRAGRGLLLLYGDLDGLKSINDLHGHHAGDRALVETSALLREVFRDSDIIARLGGDEFAVLMPDENGTMDEQAVRTRLAEAVDARNAATIEPFDLSISAGVRRYDPGQPASLDRIISEADGLMYREKKGKRPV